MQALSRKWGIRIVPPSAVRGVVDTAVCCGGCPVAVRVPHVWFPDDAACLAYLERLRWPDGFRCPRCAAPGAKAWHLSEREVRCSACRCQTSRRDDLRGDEASVHHLVPGGVVRHERPGRDRLSGAVEIDETYVGGAVPGKRRRGALGKAIVAIAVEALGVGERSKRVASGRVRLARIRDCSHPPPDEHLRER